MNAHQPARPNGLPTYPRTGDPLADPAAPSSSRGSSSPALTGPGGTTRGPAGAGGRLVPDAGGGPARLGQAGRRLRRRGMLLAVLLVLAGAGGALYVSASGSSGSQIVVLARSVPRGQVVTAADLATITVSTRGGSIRMASPDIADAAVIGKAALLDLGAGTPITPQLVASVTPDAGQVSVGVRVPSDGLPDAQLRPGQDVAVVKTDASTGDGTVIADRAQVLSVTSASTTGDADGEIVVYLSVPAAQASIVAGAAATHDGIRLLGVR